MTPTKTSDPGDRSDDDDFDDFLETIKAEEELPPEDNEPPEFDPDFDLPEPDPDHAFRDAMDPQALDEFDRVAAERAKHNGGPQPPRGNPMG